MIIDLTPIRDGRGPSRLLDLVPGRSKKVFEDWLGQQKKEFRDGNEVVAMDEFSGFRTAAAEEIPRATAVMDPFHVVAFAGEKVDQCRQRVQQATCGPRGRSGDPFYGSRCVLHTAADLLIDRQIDGLNAVFVEYKHVEVEATWGIYQRIIAA